MLFQVTKNQPTISIHNPPWAFSQCSSAKSGSATSPCTSEIPVKDDHIKVTCYLIPKGVPMFIWFLDGTPGTPSCMKPGGVICPPKICLLNTLELSLPEGRHQLVLFSHTLGPWFSNQELSSFYWVLSHLIVFFSKELSVWLTMFFHCQ